MNTHILIASFMLALAAAYEFNDPVYNQILANDLAELEENFDKPLHPRERRDEEAAMTDKCKPHHLRKKKLCCGDEVMDELHEKDKEIKRECFREVTGRDKGERGPHSHGEFDPFRCEKVEKHRKEMTCVMECFGQKKDLLDGQGEPKEDNFVAFLKETFGKQEWFAKILDKVASRCLLEARNVTVNHNASDSDTCNPAGIKLHHCVFREIQFGCPAEEIKDPKACSKIKEKIKRHENAAGNEEA